MSVDEVIAELNRRWYERTGRPVLKPDEPERKAA